MTTTPTANPTAQHQAIEETLSVALFYVRAPHLPKALPRALLMARRAVQLLDSAHANSEAKRFATLQAQFALLGHTLRQSGPGEGPSPAISYLVEHCGLVRHLPMLEDVEQFLVQVSGGPGHE